MTTVVYSPVQLARLLRVPEPTPEQAAVIAAPLGPLAVVAGAGSGKSETMAARLVWLVANGMVRPDRVLGLTFTRKAAAEFADRVRSRLERLRRAGLADPKDASATENEDPFAGDPVIGTYHAYAGRLVGDNALREGLEPSMRLITPALSWQLAASIVAAYNGPMDEIIWTPQTVTAAVLELAGDLSEHLRETGEVTAVGRWLTAELGALPGRVPGSVRKIMETQRAREQLLPLVERYAAAKAAREVLDHGDQVALAARIASQHPEVGAAERARYHVVLLDEYQDTSHAQLVLLRSLFGGGHPVTAVGDPCQSIYGWRGASAGNLRRFTADFPVVARMRPFGASAPTGPAPVLLLSTSFRNAARVLDAAAVVQEELRYEAPDVPRLVSAPDRGERGAVACALLDTVTGEAGWVAGQIASLLALDPGCAPDGQAWPDGRQAGVRPSDVAVLCRKRSQFVALRHAIEARGIPVEVVGLGGLLVVPEVQDVVATLRVLQDAGASDALPACTGPRWRIGPTGRRECRRILEPLDSRATAADIGLHQDRKPQIRGRRHDRLRAVREPRLGIRHPQLFEQVELKRFRRIHPVCGRAIHDRDADAVQVAQPLQRVERRLAVSAQIGGRARAVEHQRVRYASLRGVVRVRRGIEPDVRHAPPIQLGEQGAKPIGMLVEDGDRIHRDSQMEEWTRGCDRTGKDSGVTPTPRPLASCNRAAQSSRWPQPTPRRRSTAANPP